MPIKVSFGYTFCYGQGSCPDHPEECTVDAEVTEGDPGCRTLPNGDPGYPPSPPEVSSITVKGQDGKEIEESVWECERDSIEEKAIEAAREKAAEDRDCRADHEYDKMRDREDERDWDSRQSRLDDAEAHEAGSE